MAVGINTNCLDMFKQLKLGYSPPRVTRTFIQEYYFGEDAVSQFIGNSMHVFLVDIPKLEFAALIPKGAYVTLCMLGEDIDKSMIQKFRFARQAIIRTVSQEQKNDKKRKDMSIILWDMFTGSAPYTKIILRTLHPLFLTRFIFNLIMSLLNLNKQQTKGGMTWHPAH